MYDLLLFVIKALGKSFTYAATSLNPELKHVHAIPLFRDPTSPHFPNIAASPSAKPLPSCLIPFSFSMTGPFREFLLQAADIGVQAVLLVSGTGNKPKKDP